MVYFIIPVVLGIVLFVLMGNLEYDILQDCGNGPECQVLSNALLPLRILPFGFIILGVVVGIYSIINTSATVDRDITREEPWEEEPPSMPIGNLLKRDILTDSNGGQA